MGKCQKTQKYHTQEHQKVSPFPAGDHKAAMNRQESMTNTKQITKMIHKRSSALNGQ